MSPVKRLDDDGMVALYTLDKFNTPVLSLFYVDIRTSKIYKRIRLDALELRLIGE